MFSLFELELHFFLSKSIIYSAEVRVNPDSQLLFYPSDPSVTIVQNWRELENEVAHFWGQSKL
jgi:hypothetical protein